MGSEMCIRDSCWDGIMDASISSLSASAIKAQSVAFEVVETSSSSEEDDDTSRVDAETPSQRS